MILTLEALQAKHGDSLILHFGSADAPKFIEIDLVSKSLRTTAASGENRATPVKNLERADGMIFLQGAEAGRAFSFVIAEATGMATIAVAKESGGVIIFGACTPVASK